jgi:sec-independent protein translocase protein TatA
MNPRIAKPPHIWSGLLPYKVVPRAWLRRVVMSTHLVLAAFGIGPPELLVIAVIGLLIFGKRLPEVGKSLGKSIVEFKKGLSGVEDDINNAATAPPRQDILPPPRSSDTVQRTETTQNQSTPTGQAS